MEGNNCNIMDSIPQSAQSHLNMVQGIIQRMSANSTSCKAWAITLVSALLVIISNQDGPDYGLIAFLPVLLFFGLDTYYLSLEKRFRKSHDTFIKKLHEGSLQVSDLFAITPEENAVKMFFKSAKSLSICTFYPILFILVLIIYSN